MKGLNNLICSNDSEVIRAVNDYIDNGYNYFCELNIEDQKLLTSLCITAIGEDAYKCLVENNHCMLLTHHLKQYLQTGKNEYAADIAETMGTIALQYFSEVLEDLFQDLCYARKHRKRISDDIVSFVKNLTCTKSLIESFGA
jgi:hypothetical protein